MVAQGGAVASTAASAAARAAADAARDSVLPMSRSRASAWAARTVRGPPTPRRRARAAPLGRCSDSAPGSMAPQPRVAGALRHSCRGAGRDMGHATHLQVHILVDDAHVHNETCPVSTGGGTRRVQSVRDMGHATHLQVHIVAERHLARRRLARLADLRVEKPVAVCESSAPHLKKFRHSLSIKMVVQKQSARS